MVRANGTAATQPQGRPAARSGRSFAARIATIARPEGRAENEND
jgi:hypothetical protein